MNRLFSLCLAAVLGIPGATLRAVEPPLLLRAESLTVLPNSQPVAYVRLRNNSDFAYAGQVTLHVPEPWRVTPSAHQVQVAPQEEQRLAFSVEGGRTSRENEYWVEIVATSGDQEIKNRQRIVVASAPYFKPTIDGDSTDWKDAIPVVFTVAGKATTISTFWNRRSFSILIAVEEEELVTPAQAQVFDAVQFVLAPAGTTTGRSPDEETARFEYLLVATPDGGACYQLAAPGMKLSETTEQRGWETLRSEDAEVVVQRRDGITYYECSLPFKPMRTQIRPSEGREFYLGVLVHDPDGTGIRDWGAAAGLWESQRTWFAWSRWTGAKWGDQPPMDCRTQWGMCSSKY